MLCYVLKNTTTIIIIIWFIIYVLIFFLFYVIFWSQVKPKGTKQLNQNSDNLKCLPKGLFPLKP